MNEPTNDNSRPWGFRHMAEHADWWARARMRLDWQSMRSFAKFDSQFGLAEPMILRSADLWVLGTWYDGKWVKVTESAYYELEGFVPLQWAEPTIEDHRLLARD